MLWINGTFDFTLMIVVINWASFSFLIFSFHFGGCRVWQVTICVGHCSTHIGFIAISLLYKTFQEYVLLLWNKFGRLVRFNDSLRVSLRIWTSIWATFSTLNCWQLMGLQPLKDPYSVSCSSLKKWLSSTSISLNFETYLADSRH